MAQLLKIDSTNREQEIPPYLKKKENESKPKTKSRPAKDATKKSK